MESLKFEMLKKKSSTYLYLFNDEQLYTIDKKRKEHTTYRCKNRKCHNTLKIKNGICIRLQHTTHHEEDGGEVEYINLKKEINWANNLDLNGESAASFLRKNNLPSTSKWRQKLYSSLKAKIPTKFLQKRQRR